MSMSKKVIQEALGHIFRGIDMLQKQFSQRLFTIDWRLVGDIGEIIAATEFDIKLDDKGRAVHDGETSDRRLVQITATFQDQLTFKTSCISGLNCSGTADTKLFLMGRVRLSSTTTRTAKTSG
jgi:hypothetical protein